MKGQLQVVKRKREKAIWKNIRRLFWTTYVRKCAGHTEEGLSVNYCTKVTKKTYIANNANFNGMKIYGIGEVCIGRYFHSGQRCSIITDVHNYEGRAIPYDNDVVVKSVVIDDFVWIGSQVLILGGYTLEKVQLSKRGQW